MPVSTPSSNLSLAEPLDTAGLGCAVSAAWNSAVRLMHLVSGLIVRATFLRVIDR